MSNNSSNKKIAKNTIYLYIRMMVVMLVTLYTSRIILNVLGASDYGIYNVVGGVVTIMSFLNAALAASTSRFLTYSLGTGDKNKLKDTFSASLNLHLIIAIVVLVLGETIGLWFFYEKIVIPDGRMTAAFWVYQFSIITTMMNFTQVPYNASLIAHEKLSIYAYVGLYEAISKLVIAYLIIISPIDNLIWYGLLIMLNSILVRSFYRFYAIKHYSECAFRLIYDKKLYRELICYSGWDLFGNLAVVCQNQGVNIVLNLFFGPVVNTARAIAVQIQGAATMFVDNFMTAVRPQVIKNCAEGNTEKMYSLTFYSAKFSYMLMLALIVPVCFEIKFFLSIWLGDAVPEETALFAVLVLITYTWRTFHVAALMPFHAIGKIRTGNVTIGSLVIATLPIGYLLFRFGAPAYSIFMVIFAVEFLRVFIIYWLLHKYIYFPYHYLFTKILLPSLAVSLVTLFFPLLLYIHMVEGWPRLILLTAVTEISLLISALYIGLNKSERKSIFQLAKMRMKK